MSIGKLFQPAAKSRPPALGLVSDPRARNVLLDLQRKASLEDDWCWLYALLQISRPFRAISLGRPPLIELIALASALSDAGARHLECLGNDSPCLPVWNHTLARAGLDWLVRFRTDLDPTRRAPADLLWLNVANYPRSLLAGGLSRHALVIGRHLIGSPAEFIATAARIGSHRFRLLHDSPESAGFWVVGGNAAGSH
ncbi:MAG: hypothetical protein ACXIUB_05110 [Wenzhouxiangella sp.]